MQSKRKILWIGLACFSLLIIIMVIVCFNDGYNVCEFCGSKYKKAYTIYIDDGLHDCCEDCYNEYWNEDPSETENNGETTYQETTEETSQDDNSKLALEQQYIFGDGIDKENNHYEIVGNVNESYNGSELEVGVLKNGKWLIELTTDNPFIQNKLWDYSGYNADKNFCGFLNAGTFYISDKRFMYDFEYSSYNDNDLFVWNVETNKSKWVMGAGSEHTLNDYSELGNDRNNKYVYISSKVSGLYNEVKLNFLDTKSLKVKELYTVTSSNENCSQISEGLFYASIDFKNKVGIETFYNEDGSVAFDLREFNNSETDIVYVGDFKDGQCEIRNELKNGTKYLIIIDKTGKAIKSEKIE